MATAKELREKRGELNKKFQDIVRIAESENRDVTPEEDAILKQINDDDQVLINRIQRIEDAAARDAELSKTLDYAANRIRENGIPGGDGEATPDVFNIALTAWARSQLGMELSDRQMQACNEARVNPNADRFRVELSTTAELLQARNALQTKVPGKGGAWIAPSFVRQLEQAQLEWGPMLQVADIMTTDTGVELPWPTFNDTGNEGELTSELKQVGDTSLSTAAMLFGSHEMTTGVITVSQASLQDSAFDLPSIIASAFGERLGKGQNRLLTLGNTPNAPRGIVPSATVGKETASSTALAAEEVIDLIHSVPKPYRNSPRFAIMANESVWLGLRKLRATNDGQFLWQPGLQQGMPDTFYGKRVLENTHMEGTLAAGNRVMLAGDFSKYKVRQVRQMYLRRMTEKYADKNADGFVAFIRFDGGLLDAGTHPIKCLRMKP